MYQKRELVLQESPFKKCATIYSDNSQESKACILYFHGGGLLYGNREDLPETHLNRMTEEGYTIIAYDYPLAPIAKIDMIKEDICASINDFIENKSKYTPLDIPYFLWGRSSGAYLCLIAACSGKLKEKPAGVLSYYGYGFLTNNWYQIPSNFYKKLPAVPESCLAGTPQELHTYGDLTTHYSVYVYARQTGKWKDLFYEGRDKYFLLDYSLRTIDSFPCPLFCAHATGDTDVPYQEFLELCNKYQPRRFIAATKEHDFDRDETGPYIKRLLDATLSFLYEKMPSPTTYAGRRHN